MTLFSRFLFLFCVGTFLLVPASQAPRKYKIYSPEKIQTGLKEVVEMKSIEKLQSRNFPEDFEIEMRNVSKKPIYFMHVMVIFSGTSGLGGGNPVGLQVSFGNNRKLVSISNRPSPSDIPAKPGETFVLKPENNDAKNVRKFFEDRVGSSNVEKVMSDVILVFQTINFGDGTGYMGGEPDSDQKVSQNTSSSNKEDLRKSFLVSTKSTPYTKAQTCSNWKITDESPVECVNPNCFVNQTGLSGPVLRRLCSRCKPCDNGGCCNDDFLGDCSVDFCPI
jgi:hypothetical protein